MGTIVTVTAGLTGLPTSSFTGLTNITKLTRSEYDALVVAGTVDPDTLYIITPDP